MSLQSKKVCSVLRKLLEQLNSWKMLEMQMEQSLQIVVRLLNRLNLREKKATAAENLLIVPVVDAGVQLVGRTTPIDFQVLSLKDLERNFRNFRLEFGNLRTLMTSCQELVFRLQNLVDPFEEAPSTLQNAEVIALKSLHLVSQRIAEDYWRKFDLMQGLSGYDSAQVAQLAAQWSSTSLNDASECLCEDLAATNWAP